MDSQLNFKIHTFGCKVNSYDSGLIVKNLERNGFVNQTEDSGVHVLNTCAVTAEATKEALRLARRIKAKEPFSTVIVTGCAAQVDTESFQDLPAVDLIVANSHKANLPFILRQYFKGEIKDRVFKTNIFKKEDLEPGGGEEAHHTRSFLKIQDGCNSFCTYCVIPFARGKSRSLTISHLVQRLQNLSEQGVQEAVLTGVHIGDYQDDSRPQNGKLEDLLEEVLKRTKMARIRLTSLEPVEVSDRLLDIYQDPRMCRHFHMSIQSANSQVLKDMKRHYNQEDVEESLNKIHSRLPGSFVGMDVIVGFPTETQELFEDTYFRLANLPWTRIHVFPYSQRPGTYAARLPQLVSPKELHIRALRMRELSLHRYQEISSEQIGKVKDVLLLKSRRGGLTGLSRDYWNVQFQDMSQLAGLQAGMEIKSKILGSQQANAKSMESPLLAEVCL